MRKNRFPILVAGVLCLASLVLSFGGEALAETPPPTHPISNPNPGADLWRAVRGSIDAPTVSQVKGRDASVLVHRDGERWMSFRVDELIPNGGNFLIVILLLIGAIYAIRGPVKLAGGESGVLLERNSVGARVIHWLLAGIFILLAISGLVLLFGRPLLIPLFGKTGFAVIASVCKEAHNLVGPIFPLILLASFFRLVSRNLYEQGDLKWFARGGGMVGKAHVSAGKFNGGEKLLFWLTMFLGVAISVTGYVLDFPVLAAWVQNVSSDFNQYRQVMEFAHVVHGVVAVVFIGLIFGHIFMATALVRGSLSSMTSGKVDANWAKEHHDRWYQEMQADPDQPGN
jgi:formate dehydrogenase subunit gamma